MVRKQALNKMVSAEVKRQLKKLVKTSTLSVLKKGTKAIYGDSGRPAGRR